MSIRSGICELCIVGSQAFVPGTGKLVLADVLWAQRVRRLTEVAGEILDGHEVRPRGTLGIISTLEFFEHQVA